MDIKKALTDSDLFKELSGSAIDKITLMCKAVNVRAGETIISKGENEYDLFVVADGRVSLELELPNNSVPIELDQAMKNEVFGEMALVKEFRRSAYAVAMLDTTLLQISSKDLNSLLDSDHDAGYIVMANLSRILSNRLVTTNIHLLKTHKGS